MPSGIGGTLFETCDRAINASAATLGPSTACWAGIPVALFLLLVMYLVLPLLGYIWWVYHIKAVAPLAQGECRSRAENAEPRAYVQVSCGVRIECAGIEKCLRALPGVVEGVVEMIQQGLEPPQPNLVSSPNLKRANLRNDEAPGSIRHH